VPADEEEKEHILDRLITRRFEGDPDLRIKFLKWFWLISLLMMLGGYAIMLLILFGRSPF
jgi:hypothetical protein